METQRNPVEAYIAAEERPEVRARMEALRTAILESAPGAQEKISWQMPTFVRNGTLVHFAAHRQHIGFYPGAEGIEAFAGRLTDYKTSKGAVQFPLDRPLPLALVREIVRYRAAQNDAWAAEKTKG